MESLLIGSFPKRLPSLSFPVSADLSSAKAGSLCVPHQGSISKAWNNVPQKYNPLRLRRQLVTCQIGGSDDVSVIITQDHDNTKYIPNNAAPRLHVEADEQEELTPSPLQTVWKSILTNFDAFYRFSRPYTVKGTIMSVISVSLLAIQKFSDFNPAFFTGLFQALAAALLINTFVVGYNQLTDIEIDRVNKPFLPLASGEYSFTTGAIIVAVSTALSFWLAWSVRSWPLAVAVFNCFLVGFVYSTDLPNLRWKTNPFLASMSILFMRAVNIQVGYYLHMQTHVFGRSIMFPKALIFATAVMTFIAIVIALFKDIPDLEGDKTFGNKTFTVQLGQKKMFWICVSVLEAAYVVAMLMGLASPFTWSRYATVLGHAGLALILWNRATSIDLKSNRELTSFYLFIWELFYAEYLLIPLVR